MLCREQAGPRHQTEPGVRGSLQIVHSSDCRRSQGDSTPQAGDAKTAGELSNLSMGKVQRCPRSKLIISILKNRHCIKKKFGFLTKSLLEEPELYSEEEISRLLLTIDELRKRLENIRVKHLDGDVRDACDGTRLSRLGTRRYCTACSTACICHYSAC